MFENKKYITRGIQSELDDFTQLFLWSDIERIRNKVALDYLQVFKLLPIEKDGVTLQKVLHEQEQPEYKTEFYINCNTPKRLTIFCIDNTGTNEGESVMMLSEEY